MIFFYLISDICILRFNIPLMQELHVKRTSFCVIITCVIWFWIHAHLQICPWYKINLYAIQIFRNRNKKRPFQCNEWQQLAVQTKLKAFLTIFCLCIVSCTMHSALYCTLNKCPLLFLTEPSLDHYRKFPVWKQTLCQSLTKLVCKWYFYFCLSGTSFWKPHQKPNFQGKEETFLQYLRTK